MAYLTDLFLFFFCENFSIIQKKKTHVSNAETSSVSKIVGQNEHRLRYESDHSDIWIQKLFLPKKQQTFEQNLCDYGFVPAAVQRIFRKNFASESRVSPFDLRIDIW